MTEADFWFWFMAPLGISAGLLVAICIGAAALFVWGVFVETFKLIVGK